jgi:hypothetical protein
MGCNMEFEVCNFECLGEDCRVLKVCRCEYSGEDSAEFGTYCC